MASYKLIGVFGIVFRTANSLLYVLLQVMSSVVMIGSPVLFSINCIAASTSIDHPHSVMYRDITLFPAIHRQIESGERSRVEIHSRVFAGIEYNSLS